MRLIEFTTLEQHDHLNPKLWNSDDTLRPEVEIKLMAIADRFLEFVGIDIEPADVLLVGAQAAYHYTKHSDLDLHIVIDYGKIDCDQEVEELLDTKRLLFKRQHAISIRGIPVEPGAENIEQPTVSAAWSVMNRQWVRPPDHNPPQIDHKQVKIESDKWQNIIRGVLGQKDVKLAKKTLKMIRKYRKMGLKSAGEFSRENLVYKDLRNQGSVKQLEDWIADQEDQYLGISE